jgi:hypothetical protein
MSSRRNISIWLGSLVVLVAGVAYLPLVELLPSLADWVTLLIFSVGLFVIALGLVRAFRHPRIYRGKIAGPVLMTLALGMAGFFALGTFYMARQVPQSRGAPQVGQQAPEFKLLDKDGRETSLSDLLGAGGVHHGNGAVLIFYRGHW